MKENATVYENTLILFAFHQPSKAKGNKTGQQVPQCDRHEQALAERDVDADEDGCCVDVLVS